MKNILKNITKFGYPIMFTGMFIGVAGFLLLMRAREHHVDDPRALAIGLIGIVIYLGGRIILFIAARNRSKQCDSNPDKE